MVIRFSIVYAGVGDTGPIELCECEEATGNNGLSCDKEGWFISGVQRVGVMVDAVRCHVI